ncbi:hypothetical protein ASJ35_18005 [Ruthenibacterium lactatiformans]|uniref:Uncharacterized protein n=1 Tax=Ruthenibacterium lactatiformans TaxID=1550024 RepID=A0A0W7TLC0_9FIRM|nr:hypothetical protein ASJ35_18005 [Ruthenibacterium lactatiformans]
MAAGILTSSEKIYPRLRSSSKPWALEINNRMLRQLVSEISLCGIMFQFGQDVPNSGQEYPAREMRVNFIFLLL